MLTQGGKILCRTYLRVKRSVNSETEKKDRSMAVLVGVGCCHEIGVLARLVSDAKLEQYLILLVATFGADAVLLPKFRDSRFPDFEKLLAPLAAKERVSTVAVSLSGDSLHVATIEFQIATRKISDPENVAEP